MHHLFVVHFLYKISAMSYGFIFINNVKIINKNKYICTDKYINNVL